MNDYIITVQNGSKKFNIPAKCGDLLIDLLTESGITVPASCGRCGTCSKCTVKLESGSFDGVSPDENNRIKSCKAFVCGNAGISCNFTAGTGLTENSFNKKSNRSGIAVDIGTTTVAAAFIDKSGNIRYASRLNPQSAYGGDVISRIQACAEGKLNAQTKLIRDCIKKLISELNGGEYTDIMAVSGNTTMMHIFCGISPESMGHSPFTPQFTEAKIINGNDVGFNVEKILILPSVSAFIGADITAGIHSLGLENVSGIILFADLGTNGEIVLSAGGKLFCTSTAAGPALEGGATECGVGGINGAIDSVKYVNGSIEYTTVNKAPAIGICGSGIVDTVALLKETERIDETGYFEDVELTICKNVRFTQNDIRGFQLAKSAVYSGIETLCETVGIGTAQIDRLYIAGGLGYYINPVSAVKCGLLPNIDINKIIPAGNTSLQGALNCIASFDNIEEMQKIANHCTVIDLGGNPKFNERFMENMYF